MPIEAIESADTDISGTTPAPTRTPQQISADTNRRVKAKSPGQQQQSKGGGTPGPLAALGGLAQQAGQDISGASQGISKGLKQAGFANPSGDPWNLIDYAKETAQDAGATWGLARKVAGTLGGQFSDGVSNVWQGHSGTDWLLKQMLEAGVQANPYAVLSGALQLEGQDGGFNPIDLVTSAAEVQTGLPVRALNDPQRQKFIQQYGQEEGDKRYAAWEQQQRDKVTEQQAQNLPGSYFDLATSLLAPEDRLAMLGAQAVPPIIEAFLTGGPTDQQNALEWMVGTALLSYVPFSGPVKKALIKKIPSLERVLGNVEDAQKAKQAADRGASDPGKQAQQAQDAIDKQLNRGSMPETYSEKPVARARKPSEPEQLVTLKDPDTGQLLLQQSAPKKAIQKLLKQIGVSDTDELVDKIRANAINDPKIIKQIRDNWKGLGLSYDLFRYLPEEQSLRDPRRWSDSLPESVSGVSGAIKKGAAQVTSGQLAPTEFKATTDADLVDGKPGVYRLYRGSKDGTALTKGQSASYLTSDPQYAGKFGDVHQVEYDASNPYVLHAPGNAGQLADAEIAAGELKASSRASRVRQYRKGIAPSSLGKGAVKWLTDQGHDLLVAKGAGKGKSPVGLALNPDRVNMQAAAGLEQDVGNVLGGQTEGHNFITTLNAYLDQIHRGVFGNGSDPMQSLLRAFAGDSRTVNLIDQHFMTSVVDLLKGQMTENLGNKLGRAVEGDLKAYEELPVQAKMVADGWGLLRAAAREAAIDTKYTKSFVPNWMPRADKLLGDVVRKRGRPSSADNLLAKDAKKHRDQALMLDPQGHIVLGQTFQYVADANKALAQTRQQLISDILSPGRKLSKELENDPGILQIRKLLASDPAQAAQKAEVLAWQKYADKETNFLKNISRTFANQVRAVHTHAALEQFVDMQAKDGRALALKAMSPRQRDEFRNQGYELLNDPRFLDYMFHPDLAQNLNRYIDHIKLPDPPKFVASDGRRIIIKPQSLNQTAELTKQGYHTLEAPLFGSVGGKQPWLFHPDVQTLSDVTSQAGKYYWGKKVADAGWWYNQLLNLEGKSIAAIMFSPLVHGLNMATRWGMGYTMNLQEMTHYLFQRGAKPWNKDADSLAMRMEAYNAGVLPHVRNRNYADNLLSTMSDALGDIEDQLPDAFRETTRKGQFASLMDKRPRPMPHVNNFFWGAVNDFGVMMYHLEKTAAMKDRAILGPGMTEADAREFAARRANSWMGAVAAEDRNPNIHRAMRLLVFAPNWWRTWAELMMPIYRRAGFAGDHANLQYRAYQSAKTAAAAVAFQKLTGELLNYAATSSTPWAGDGHWQQQNQPNNQDRIEATGNWVNDIPGIDFFAPTPDVNSNDPNAKAAGERGAVRTIENPFGRQQRAIEEAAGFEEGTPYWQPQDTWDGLAKFAAARTSPLLNALAGVTNIDMYQSISDHQLRAIDTGAPAGSVSPASLLTGMIMMTPIGLQFAQNVQKSSAQGDPSPVESALGTKIPDSLQSAVGDLKDPAARMLWSWFTGTNAPYDTAQKSRGTKPSDEDYQKVVRLRTQYQQQMQALSSEALSGQITPSQWRTAYADQAKRDAMEDILLLLRGAISARGNVLLKLNVAADNLAAVTDMLPALSSPTITTLARGNMNAVETVVPKRGVNTLIPALKAAGAQDILEIPISKIVE